MKTAQTVGTFVQAISRFHESFCKHWADKSDVSAIRAIGFITLTPVVLLTALIASHPFAGLLEIVAFAASFLGVAMILCALSVMGVSATVVALLNLTVIATGLLSLGILYSSNVVLWCMGAALPLEAWLMSRKKSVTIFAVLLVVGVCGFFIQQSSGVMAGTTLAGMAAFVLYGASLLLRCVKARPVGADTLDITPKIAIASGDVQFNIDHEGVIIFADRQTAKLLGVQPEMLKATLLLDRVHVADRIQYLSLLADLRAGHAPLTAEVRLRSVEGGTTQFLPFRMEGSVIDNVISIIGRPLQNEQKLIAEIQALKATLEAERIAKGRLLADVSHELRTPLNSIIGFSDMLSHGVGGALQNDKQREYVGLIHRSGHYLLELVNSVLDNSRLETGTYGIEPKQFSFREVAEMCTSVMVPQAEKKRVAFCHRVSEEVGELTADRRAVQQILLNLAANAVKFTQPGGCVTVDAARIMIDGRAFIAISVSDTGVGIAPEDMQRIGTPFVRADNNYTRAQEGSGLGLSVVKGLVELHQGTMQLKSNLGEGTVVTVRLPVSGPYFCVEEKGQQQLGTVIDMHRHQGEISNDWQKDENHEKAYAQNRKTA